MLEDSPNVTSEPARPPVEPAVCRVCGEIVPRPNDPDHCVCDRCCLPFAVPGVGRTQPDLAAETDKRYHGEMENGED